MRNLVFVLTLGLESTLPLPYATVEAVEQEMLCID